jgi:hypothetical protein
MRRDLTPPVLLLFPSRDCVTMQAPAVNDAAGESALSATRFLQDHTRDESVGKFPHKAFVLCLTETTGSLSLAAHECQLFPGALSNCDECM